MVSSRGFFGAFVLAAAVASAVAVAPQPGLASHTVPVTVTITRVTAIGDDLEDLRGDEDLYAGVRIAGVLQDSFAIHVDGDGDIEPFWTFTTQVTGENVDTPVSIEIWEHDDCDKAFCNDTGIFESNDDKADVDPGGDDDVNLTVPLATGRWTGDAPWPQNCSQGTGDNAAKVCWDIAVGGSDSDGDGLLDGWEINGFNADGDNTIDVDLPAMGADPLRKDLFLELDYTIGQTPGRDDIQAMKAAMAVAPLGNPSGPPGVNLWVDMGNLVDPNAREGAVAGTCTDGVDNRADGQADAADPDCGGGGQWIETSVEDPLPGNCTDNVDNDGDTLADANDPDCLVGDNLGGGNAVAALDNCGLDGVFYAVKGNPANFAPARAQIFRYAISTRNDPDTDGAGPDTGCNSGGQGEIGGNDFIEYNHDGGTIFHELGHNLNLRHGGFENKNCKPNYVSQMNYDLQFGIPRVGGGSIIDYSPPRVALNGSTRGSAPLGNLVENDLDETAVLDATDANNRFVFVNALNAKVVNTLNAPPDWDGAGGTTNTGAQSNVDNGVPPGPNAAPSACVNGSNNDTLAGSHDWTRVSIPFRGFGDSEDGAINPETTPEPTLDELRAVDELLNTTDLAVAITDAPDPVAAGESMTYRVEVRNVGPNPASSVQVTSALPGDLTAITASIPCQATGTTLVCSLGELLSGASRSFTISAAVPADLVYVHGGPKTIVASTSADNLLGTDPTPGNDAAFTTTLVVAKADVAVTSATNTAPVEVLIGEPGSAALSATVANLGPSSPIDTDLAFTTTSSSGLTVSPASGTAEVNALTAGAPQSSAQSLTVACATPGPKTVTIEYSLTLRNLEDIDPDVSNNAAATTFTVDCVVPIAVNVRPHGFPNSVNLNTDATLAALTTAAGEYGLPLAFDAATIDPLSVRWGLRSSLFNVATPTGANESHGLGHVEDSYELDERTRDRDRDMVLHFKPAAGGLSTATTSACLKGSFVTADGTTYRFLGCDSVVIRP